MFTTRNGPEPRPDHCYPPATSRARLAAVADTTSDVGIIILSDSEGEARTDTAAETTAAPKQNATSLGLGPSAHSWDSVHVDDVTLLLDLLCEMFESNRWYSRCFVG